MRKAGHNVGRDQVARLMGVVGIEGVRRGKHRTVTTRRDPAAARHPDLINRAWLTPTRPNQWSVADFTYVWTLAGFVYTSFVSDVFSRRILGRRVASSKTTPLVMSALEQALFTRRRANARFTAHGLVFHSDAGSQYTAISFTEALIDAGMAPSIGTVGDALDNALMESTIGLYKTELIEHDRTRSWSGRAEVERETASCVHWYNTTRIITPSPSDRRSSSKSTTVTQASPRPGRLPNPSLHQTQGDSMPQAEVMFHVAPLGPVSALVTETSCRSGRARRSSMGTDWVTLPKFSNS